ncbi:MAG: insulinase family protein [Pseudomonadota bacterium]
MFYGNVATLLSRALAIALTITLAGCATPEKPADPQPDQSPNDRFDYRLVTLDNGLKALLISNPDSPKAAASLDVQVGSGDNPVGRAGLAHFLEHMLFLGTEKYPDPAEYEQYITEHGGSRNAYTSFEHTNYFFDVDAEHLNGALDRFAQFFIAPNFDAEYVDRERNAVQAEYQMGLNSDGRRGLDVLQAAMNPEHPFSQFSVGSLETLADRPDATIREDLLKFYDKHYSANVMRLAVLGTEPLDELEAMVRGDFAAVPNRNVELKQIEAPLFVDAQLPMFLKITPQGTLRSLQLSFQIADYRPEYLAKPMAYVSNLVGHEGEGSLLSSLKSAGLADGLSSGTGLNWRGGSLFSVTVSLTEKGVANYEEVIAEVFAFLELLRETGAEAWRYDEQSSLAALAFRFREPMSPIGYVSNLTNAMHYYADEDILSGPYRMERFDEKLIEDALAVLVPERVQVVLTAPEVATDRNSQYYDVPYALMGPEAILLSKWTGAVGEDLGLPAANPFIAEDVDLLPLADEAAAVPEIVLEAERQRIWYRQARDFRVPKGAMYLSFRSPLAANTASNAAAAALYTRVVKDALNEFTYPALLAGLGFDFYRHSQGISMRVSGYNDKQFMLVEALLGSIATQEFDAQRFERLRREMVLELQNTAARRPTSQLIGQVRRALSSGAYPEEDLIAALEAMDVDSLSAYRAAFWDSARAEALLYGNYDENAPQVLSASLTSLLPEGAGDPALAPAILKLDIADPLQLTVQLDHADAVVAWYLQGKGQTWADRAKVALTAQAVSSGFFQQLRTEQQLGYVVSSFSYPQYDVPGLLLLIQSPSHPATDVYQAMDEFLARVPDDITEEQFLRHRAALVNDILKPDENLGQRAEFYWQAIAFREWGFDESQILAGAVESVSYEDWKAYYIDAFLEDRRSMLNVAPGARGESPKIEANAVYTVPEELRQGRPTFTVDLAPL